MEIYDCHLHTIYSADGKSTVDELCEVAISKGIKAITITDHNAPLPKGFSRYENIRASVLEAQRKNEELNGKLMVLSGVELDGQLKDDYDCRPFFEIEGIDCILGSLHTSPIIEKYFPHKPFGYRIVTADMDTLREFIDLYYKELLHKAENPDADVITHLTYPFRYINGKAKRGLEISEFYPLIDEVLKAIIKTDKSLEVNTSGFSWEWREFMPNEDVIKRYYSYGGRNVTIGSDAHETKNLGVGIPEAQKMLKSLGFKYGSYYVKRKRYEYEF